jgi:hypothetical protein
MPIPKDPAALESRLLDAIECLRFIRAALDDIARASRDADLVNCCRLCETLANGAIRELTS